MTWCSLAFVDTNKDNGDKDHTDDEEPAIEGTMIIPTSRT